MSRLEQKAQTRKHIIESAGRNFRRHGFGGAGVDAVASEAGVTSGAFYGHFKTKGLLFEESVVAGLKLLEEAILDVQANYGDDWWKTFVKFYLSEKLTCDIAETCALQSLSNEVARFGSESKKRYEQALKKVVKAVLKGSGSKGAPKDEESAFYCLSVLAGAVSISRACSSKKLASSIAKAAQLQLIGE